MFLFVGSCPAVFMFGFTGGCWGVQLGGAQRPCAIEEVAAYQGMFLKMGPSDIDDVATRFAEDSA